MSGHRSFAFRLYAQIWGGESSDENVLLSPYGVWSALAGLLPGSGGTTRDQLTGLLGIDDLEPVRHLADTLARRERLTDQQRMLVERNLTRTIDPESLRVHLFQGRSLWIQDGYQVAPSYLAAQEEFRDITLARVDFANAPEDACAAINRWASDVTAGRIRSILDARSLSPVTRAILTSAIHFKARWAETFTERETHDAPFVRLDGSRVSVPTMRRVGPCGYTADDDVRVVELPYNHPDLVMDLIMPRPGRFEAVERVMSMAYLFVLVGELDHQAQVDLHLPRFAIECDLRLGDALTALGADEVFGSSADFTALSGEPGFHLDDVLHRTCVSIDEHGSEIAAMTRPMMVPAASGVASQPIEVRIDRPFFFLVRDVPSNSILFFGRCGDPGV